jgi:phosphatidylglycerophosphate synthase
VVAFGSVCLGAGAFAAGMPRIGAVLTHVGSVLDGVDGEVARLQGTASPAGALFDLVLDRISDVAVLVGLASGVGGRKVDWLLALAGTNGILISGLIKERVGAERLSVSDLQRLESANGALDALLPWTGRDSRLLGIAMAALAGSPRAGLIWAAAASNLRLIRRLAAARAMLRDAVARGAGDDLALNQPPIAAGLRQA